MGQQQLLLLVLGMVIVGIAVVAGIQAFGEGKEKASRDAAVSDAMRVISDIQAWKMKPAAFGGGSSATSIPTFNDLGYPSGDISSSGARYTTVSGCYDIVSGGTVATVELRLLDSAGACVTDDFASVAIAGTTVDDLTWTYATSGS